MRPSPSRVALAHLTRQAARNTAGYPILRVLAYWFRGDPGSGSGIVWGTLQVAHHLADYRNRPHAMNAVKRDQNAVAKMFRQWGPTKVSRPTVAGDEAVGDVDFQFYVRRDPHGGVEPGDGARVKRPRDTGDVGDEVTDAEAVTLFEDLLKSIARALGLKLQEGRTWRMATSD